MIDREFILNTAKQNATPIDKKKNEDWNRSFDLALIDLSARLVEKDRLVIQNIKVPVGTRDLILKGVNSDISQIYYLSYGSGDEQSVLEYVDDNIFIKDYNSTTADAGQPSKYTFIGLDQGSIQIRFDVPTETASTMDVWYYKHIDQTLIRTTKGPALVDITKAYFYGKDTDRGNKVYWAGLNLVTAIRANVKPVADKESKFRSSRFTRRVERIRRSYRGRR